jgi:hypothetical protein
MLSFVKFVLTAISLAGSAQALPQGGGTGVVPGQPGPGITPQEQASLTSFHNNERVQHGATPLAWNPALASQAQTYASACALTHSPQYLGHAVGENLVWGTYGPYTVTSAFQSWTAERRKCPFALSSCLRLTDSAFQPATSSETLPRSLPIGLKSFGKRRHNSVAALPPARLP